MWYKSDNKRFFLYLALGAGILLLAFASLFFMMNRPTQAQLQAANLQIDVWAPGRPGVDAGISSNLVLNIEYRNVGVVDAPGIVITGTLEGLTYISDTADAVPSGSGSVADPFRWDIGVVPAGEAAQFQLFATVAVTATEQVTSSVGIFAEPTIPLEGFPTDRRDTWTGTVWEQGSYLSASKSALTQNPVPGESFIYVLDVCNTGYRWPVDSTVVNVTDTLPAGTSLAGWWSEEAGWELVDATAQPLVFTRPSIAGNTCSAIYVQVDLAADAAAGDALCNTVSVAASNNKALPVRLTTEFCHAVGWPETNLAVEKTWAEGQLVPGGYAVYEVIVRNAGNTTVAGPVSLIDTMPPNATFVEVMADADAPFALDNIVPQVDGSQLTWQLSNIEPGEWARFWLTLNLNSPAGTDVTNMIVVGSAPGEIDLADNSASWTETIGPAGEANLRVRKTGEWLNFALNPHRIRYTVVVENVGDQPIAQVVLVDNYDARMPIAHDPAIHASVWDQIVATRDVAASTLTVTVTQLTAGDSVAFDFETWLTTGTLPGGPVDPGLVFTNSVTASAMGLPDATAMVEMPTGPDLELEKAHVAGIPQPGDLVTFTLTIRNTQPDSYWWWGLRGDAVVTDTLPAGLTFESAALWDCGDAMWCAFPPTVDGQVLTWTMPSIRAGRWNVIRLVARVGAGVEDQAQLTNTAVAGTVHALDVEVDLSNNMDTATLTVLTDIDVAFTKSVTPGAGVEPGDVVTYTLVMDNIGTAVLADLTLIDVLHPALVFGDFVAMGTNVTPDPVFANGTITWSGTLPTGTQPAVIIFTATLGMDSTLYEESIMNQAVLQLAGVTLAEASASFITQTETVIYLPLIFREYTR